MCGEVKPITEQLTWPLKTWLKVRQSCANDVCLDEVGYPSLPKLIPCKQHKYFYNIWAEIRGMDDDPLLQSYLYIRVLQDTKIPRYKLGNEPNRCPRILGNIHHMSRKHLVTPSEWKKKLNTKKIIKQKRLNKTSVKLFLSLS